MAASSPRKYVPLAPGHEPTVSTKHESSAEELVTRRAFFAAVVVEEGIDGISEDVQELIGALGTRVVDQTQSGIEKSASAPFATADAPDLQRSTITRKRAMTEGTNLRTMVGHKRTLTQTESDVLQDMIRELITTERTYVKRLRILKQDYADPLRNFSKKKEEALLDKYKAKTLFGNIDQLLPVNEAFLNDLEKMIGPNGTKTVGGLGDVCLKHFRDKRAFDIYRLYYAKREEALAIFEEEMGKGTKSGFPAYIERIKYSSSDVRNRIGLRELLAEPIQRIPRYTMMWQNIIKEMDDAHPQKTKMMEAERIASKIALCESDDQTKKATTMYCLERTVEGFPPGLISNSRNFIDCIDVEDMSLDPIPAGSATGSSSGIGALHCTLFLFDDRLVIVKRPNGNSCGRTLARLDDIDKLIRTNTLTSVKKSGMTCKGIVDIVEVTATDAAGPDLHVYLENPPQDQSDRWNGRPFRSFAVVLPPSPLNLDPTATQIAKTRFLNNLWTAQAMYRAKNGRSVALRSEENVVDSRVGCKTIATGFYNIYQRTSYLGEPKKHKVVVHIDPSREADAVPFGLVGGGPFVVIRLQPLAGELCRYNVTCNDADEEEEESIVHSEVVPTRIIQTIHQFGLFTFKTGVVSRPTTPTASTRSRAAIFGLDVIPRGLLSTSRSGRSGEAFSFGASVSGTLSGTKRSKGGMSRSSTQTMSTESTNRFSHRSNSTAGTSLSESDDLMSLKSPRKLVKRGRSPGRISESEHESAGSRPVSGRFDHSPRFAQKLDESEKDLAMRLELAKQNSLSQDLHSMDTQSFMLRDPPFAETIYEEDPPGSRVTPDRRPKLPDETVDLDDDDDDDRRPASTTPTRAIITPSKPLPAVPRKPAGPRQSLAPPKLIEMPAFDVEAAIDETIAAFSPPHFDADVSDEDEPIQIPLELTNNTDISRTPTRSSTASVEPLSIKKKSSVKPRKSPRKSPGSFRRIRVNEPTSPSLRTKDLKHTPSMVRSPPRNRSFKGPGKGQHVERIVVVAKTTKEDLSSARRAVKRIKQEVDVLREDVAKDFTSGQLERTGAISPTGGVKGITRSPLMRQMANKAAEARMEEMRQMINRRSVEIPRTLPISPTSSNATSSFDMSRLEKWTRTIESLVEDADKQIALAIDQNEALCKDMALLAIDTESPSNSDELEKMRVELQGSKRQTDLLKQLLHDTTTENEILYSTFNQELNDMYQDVQLPEDQAWSAMIEDLKKAKQTRNQLSKENFHYKRKLQIADQRNEELLALLRAHGLEPPGQ